MISEAIPTEQKKWAYEPEKICTTKCKYYRTCVGNPNKILQCVLNAYKILDKYAFNTYNTIIKKKGGYIFEKS